MNIAKLEAPVSPAHFAMNVSRGTWLPARHLLLVNREIVRVALSNTSQFLMVELPPRHGKSFLLSKHTPPWYLGMFPDRRVILTSYETTFAESWGREGRNLMIEYGLDLFGVTVAQDSAAVGRWNIQGRDGGMVAVGMGGALTGRGGNLILIDDPVKNWADAQSETLRQHQWEWYGSTLRTRLEPGGSVILLMCMTGDTPVLCPDGSTTPLRDIRAGDVIATYDAGRLTTSTVVNWANQGPDKLFEIRMSSGTTVRANARHPFLTVDELGVEKWQRTDTLRPGDHILRATGASGAASPAPPTGVTSQLAARACACRTTTRLVGRREPVLRPSTLSPAELLESSTATGSPSTSTTRLWLPRTDDAPYAARCRPSATPARTGTGSSASTTITRPVRCGVCSATIATSSLGMASRRSDSAQPLSTWSVVPDEVVEIVPAGVEDVFDLQVYRTENFIANGLVSHNTRWHEDDLSGRLLRQAEEDPTADQWKVIRLPALAEPEVGEHVETLGAWRDAIGRSAGEALWPERFPAEVLRKTARSVGPLIFDALYQQRPTNREGGMFQTQNWRYCDAPPAQLQWVRRWDLAGTEKKTGGDPDWTAGVLMARTVQTGLTFVATVRRIRTEPEGVEKFVRGTAIEDRERWGHVRVRMSQDPGQAGKALVRYYKRQVLAGFDFDFDSESGDKVARAMPFASQQGGENVVLVRGEWNRDFIEECRTFPRGAHDDQVDAASLAYQECAGLMKRRSRLVA